MYGWSYKSSMYSTRNTLTALSIGQLIQSLKSVYHKVNVIKFLLFGLSVYSIPFLVTYFGTFAKANILSQ